MHISAFGLFCILLDMCSSSLQNSKHQRAFSTGSHLISALKIACRMFLYMEAAEECTQIYLFSMVKIHKKKLMFHYNMSNI